VARPGPDALSTSAAQDAFGGGTIRLLPVGQQLPDDADDSRAILADVASSGLGLLALGPGAPTAAFSRRDTLNNGYAAAARAVAGRGYRPVVRPVGGHLALYDADSLVLHLAAPHPDPRESFTRRFELFGHTLAEAFGAWGVDARVGAVPGEYCDGAFSINAGGRRKLVGTGQRLVRGAYLFSAVVMVRAKPELRTGLREAYDHLGLSFDPGTVGALADELGLVSMPRLRSEILVALERLITIEQPDTPRSHNNL
jgi:hypothetical protein